MQIRVLRMMGMLGKDNSVILPNSPNNRSAYNLKRYKYLLDSPFPISDKCCNIMKKKPTSTYEKETNRKPFIGQMASESKKREQGWMKTGCNAFEMTRQQSNPMAFWTEQDIYEYIVKYDLPIAEAYGDIVKNDKGKWETTGCDRTGCVYCLFGAHRDKTPRLQMLKQTHPKQYEYCMKPVSEGGLGLKDVIDWINENSGGKTHIDY